MDDNGSDSPTLLDYLNTAGTTATGVLSALNKPKTPKPMQANWGIIGGIAAAVIAVLVLIVVVSSGRRA